MILKIWYREHDGKRASREIDTDYVAFIDRDSVNTWGDPSCVITMTNAVEIRALGTVEGLAKAMNG